MLRKPKIYIWIINRENRSVQTKAYSKIQGSSVFSYLLRYLGLNAEVPENSHSDCSVFLKCRQQTSKIYV